MVTVLGSRLVRKLEISKVVIDVKLQSLPNITIRLDCWREKNARDLRQQVCDEVKHGGRGELAGQRSSACPLLK